MIRAARWLWKTGILSTFLAGLFAVLPIVITVGIMAWVGGLLEGVARSGKLRGQVFVPNGKIREDKEKVQEFAQQANETTGDAIDQSK